ncbi:MAG: hypothetical protein IJ822_05775, partial [Pyramidobacter sp.]|nr:hypothetical protein [Pyramidobacter sp.]
QRLFEAFSSAIRPSGSLPLLCLTLSDCRVICKRKMQAHAVSREGRFSSKSSAQRHEDAKKNGIFQNIAGDYERELNIHT